MLPLLLRFGSEACTLINPLILKHAYNTVVGSYGEPPDEQDMVQAAVASAAAKQAVSDANQAVIDLAEAAGQTPAAPVPVSGDAAADEAEMAAPPADDGRRPPQPGRGRLRDDVSCGRGWD